MRPLRRIKAVFPFAERLLKRLSLRMQVAILLTVAMLPVGGFAIMQGITNYEQTKELRRETFALGAIDAGQEERAAILKAFGQLDALDSQIDVEAGEAQCESVLTDFTAQVPTVPFIGFIAADGIMDCSYPDIEPRDFSEQLGFRNFLESPRPVVMAQERGEISGQQVIVISKPVYREGLLNGALSMSISSRYLEWVAGNTNLPPEARFGIVTSNGLGVAQSKSGSDFDWMPPASVLRSILTEPDRIQELESRSGTVRVYAMAPLFKRDIFAVASWPGEVVPASLGWQTLLTISLPVLMWALAVGVAYFAVDQLALRHILYLDRLVTAYGRSGRSLRAERMRDAPTEIAHLGSSFDDMATEIETRESDLVQTVSEKEALLREVNHRVKNNLQLISSLMSLQIRDAANPRERAGLERLLERVEGLALVHQKIYESENTSAVRLDGLIGEIAQNLKDGSARTPGSVTLVTTLDPVTATPDTAVPLVLFATEAIVNTFKHSLSYVDGGRLEVVLSDDEDALRLSVANSLHPVPVTDGGDGKRGIGAKLIDGFARQLRGQVIRTSTDDEFRIELVVPKVGTVRQTDETAIAA